MRYDDKGEAALATDYFYFIFSLLISLFAKDARFLVGTLLHI